MVGIFDMEIGGYSSVWPGYELIDGRHRFEALQLLGTNSAPCVIVESMTDKEKYQLSSKYNDAAETVIPNTFVDDAEFVWRMAEAGHGRRIFTHECS